MRREDLEQVLADQRKELLVRDRSRLFGRVEAAQIHLDSALAQVVIGVRRSGKSTLCQAAVLQSGRPFGYVNFDDERLASLRGEDLNTVLETLYSLNGDFDVLFLDEVQNIPEWNLFVNRLLRQGMHVLVTGSNAKLLSGELATHMVGRYHAVELFPLSFAEFCAFHGVDPADKTTLGAGLRQRVLDAYLRQGGFPELLTGDLSAPKYVSTLVSDILERDIRQRLRQRSVRPIRIVADYLLSVVPTVLNSSALGARLELGRAPNTVKTYIDHLRRAYLLVAIQKWSRKEHLRIRNEKLYPVDVALMGGGRQASPGENVGWRLETVVLIELLRRHHHLKDEVFYYQENRSEADFVVCRGNETLAVVQVSAHLSTPAVRERELRGAATAAKATGCPEATLVTLHETGEDVVDGIHVRIVRARDWLCAPTL